MLLLLLSESISARKSLWKCFPNDFLINLRGVIWFWKNSFSAINRMRQEKKDRIMIMFWKKRNFQNEQTKFGQLSKWPALRKVNPILCLLFSCKLIEYFVQCKHFVWNHFLGWIYIHLLLQFLQYATNRLPKNKIQRFPSKLVILYQDTLYHNNGFHQIAHCRVAFWS